MKTIILSCFLLFSTSAALAAESADKSQFRTLTIITHEAEPYMAQKMPGNGAIFHALSTILKKHGYEIKVIFAPSWTRAKLDLFKKKTIDGIVPVRKKEREDTLQFSDFVVLSPWVVVQRKDKPINWDKPENLKGLNAGNVQGVELRPGVQELLEKKILHVETAPNHLNSFLQLANKRTDFVFTDPFVFNYTMATEPDLEKYRDTLQMNAKPWIVERYGAAFKKSVSPDVIKALNASGDDFNRLIEEYLKNVIMQAGMKAKDAKKN